MHFNVIFILLSEFGIVVNLLIRVLFISGLTDEVLWSILRRGCQNLTSLDLSLSPHFLTEFAVLCIGMVCAVY